MNKKLTYTFVLTLIAVLCCNMIFTNPVHAEEIDTGTVNEIELPAGDETSNKIAEETPSAPTVDTEIKNPELAGVVNKLLNKIGDLTSGVQTILSSLCIIVFLIGAGKLLFGALATKRMWAPGLWVMITSGVVYVCINYATEIMSWFNSWLSL